MKEIHLAENKFKDSNTSSQKSAIQQLVKLFSMIFYLKKPLLYRKKSSSSLKQLIQLAFHFPSREVLSRLRLICLDWLRRRKSFLTSYYYKIPSDLLYLILNHYKITNISDITPSHIFIFCDPLFGFYFIETHHDPHSIIS